jgi:hypothetical protein
MKKEFSGIVSLNIRTMFIIALLLYSQLFLACSSSTRRACADGNSINYHLEANSYTNCQYPVMDINPTLLASLSDEVKESSGLALVDGHLITHNDKHNSNKLYAINPTTGSITGSITVKGTANNDWEDLAQSEDHLFIGDMGNNDGDRQNLQIYKIKISKLQFKGHTEVEADEVISFHYPAQKSFTPNKDHNFDCEALLYHNGFLYLFSKNRADSNTSLYRIPAQAGKHDAELIDTFNTGGRITGAAINSEGQLTLIGLNKKADCFIWLLDEYKGDNFFSGKKTFINLGPFKYIGQTEGIIYATPDKLFISSEATKDLSSRLYSLSLEL